MADEIFDPFANNKPADVSATEDTSESAVELDPASSLLSGEDPGPAREQALATSFEDPSILLSEITSGASQPIAQEAVEAVQELVFQQENFSAGNAENSDNSGNMETVDIAAAVDTSTWHATKAEMADKFFSLVLSEHKFETLAEEILQILLHAVDGEAGSILELDPKAQEYFFRASIGGGDKNAVKAFRVPCNKGIVGHVAESRAPLLINDLEDNQMHLRSIGAATGLEAKSCIAAPILIANQLYGVVEVFNRKGITYFDNNDVALLEDGIRMAAKVLEVRFFLATLWRERHKPEAKAA